MSMKVGRGHEQMDIKSIIKNYLRENKFEGLWNPSLECACEIKDLMPCDEAMSDCEPGYKVPCDNNCSFDGHCDWRIGPNKKQNAS